MVIGRLFISVLLFMSVFFMSFAHENSRTDADAVDLSIECRMEPAVIYERQPASLVVTLRSSSPDIAFADVVTPPSLIKGEYATFQKVSPAGNAYKEVVDGKTYYCFPLEASVITMADKGSYTIGGGEYTIGVAYPVVVNDPFWGPRRSTEVKRLNIPVKKKSFKVRDLPNPPDSIDFSGSVGQFTVETVIPRGDIFVNEEATAIVVLRGTGMIADATMPEYRDAFKNGVKLKSVSESRNAVYDNGKMISELQLECTFIPTQRDNVEIGEILFSYFDPDTGAYSVARSSPVKIEVKSSTSKRESLSI